MQGSKNIEYYRMHSAEWQVRAGLSHAKGNSIIDISPFFYSVKIEEDSNLCASETFDLTKPGLFTTNNYAGLVVGYRFLSLNDSIVATKGITFLANAVFS